MSYIQGGEEMAKVKKNNLFKRFRPKLGTMAVILAVFLLICLLFGANAVKIYNLKQQKASIQAQMEEADKKSGQLDAEIKQIGTKNYIEMIARKYLGLYYPDEKIVVPVEGKDNNQQTTEPTPTPTENTETKTTENKSEESQ